MSALTEYFFAPARGTNRTWAVVNWWESRRWLYNSAVGVTGLASLAAMFGFGALPPHPAHMLVPIEAVGAYAILANVCYSAGPVLDLVVRKKWGDEFAPVGPTLFRYGFAFSIGLTALPIPLAFMSWVVRLLFAIR
jgi:hypothetical protein